MISCSRIETSREVPCGVSEASDRRDSGHLSNRHLWLRGRSECVRISVVKAWQIFVVGTGATGCGLTSAILTFFEAGPYPVFLFCRILLAVVIGLLSTWVSERWVLRDANACRGAARPCETQNLRYGGEGFPLALVRSRQLATIVLYNVSRPDFSKIAICCLFHRLVMVGRGLNHLDEATAASRSATVQSASQTA